MIKAVLFDMDGVMFDTEKLMKQGWEKACRQMGFTLTEEHFKYMRGSSRARSTQLFEQWFGKRISYDKGRAIRTQYVNDYIAKNSVPVKEGLKELLQFLKEQRIPAAVATSTPRIQAEHYWELAGIAQFLTASVCGDEVKNSKPDPAIFLTAARKLKVSPGSCLVLEDSINGLKAACAAGAVSCMVPDLTPYTDDLAPVCSHVCASLLEVPELILDSRSEEGCL